MSSKAARSRLQFSMRSLLVGLLWFAMILALCVGQHQAAQRQRERLKAAGLLPSVSTQVVAPANPQAAVGRADDAKDLR